MLRVETRPRILLALVAVQACLAGAALALDLAGSCGSCRVGGSLRAWVAGAGLSAYAILFALGWSRKTQLFQTGIAAAAGVHAALGLVMTLAAEFCPICAASAVLGLALGLAAAARAEASAGALLWPGLPTFLLVLAALLPSEMAREGRTEARARMAAEAPARGDAVLLDVYEMDHCPYCIEFRQAFLPRLVRDFGSEVQVRFHDAAAARWVERTPTFVVDGNPAFEGLPHRYEDLERVIRGAARTRKL